MLHCGIAPKDIAKGILVNVNRRKCRYSWGLTPEFADSLYNTTGDDEQVVFSPRGSCILSVEGISIH